MGEVLMRTIYLRLPDGNPELETGAKIVRAHLDAKGHKIVRNKTKEYDVTLCWGCSMHDPLVKRVPALNGNVNQFNKLQALGQFRKKHIMIPLTITLEHATNLINLKAGPWFGRNISHAKGKDIKIFETGEEVQRLGDKDFYTLYVPHTEELRVWVFQGKAFAIYQKHFKKPGLDNYKNLECRSELREDLLHTRRLTEKAAEAVDALKMDFGAVDILHGEDKGYYVLEVNSMPDISSMIRVSGIRLADLISRWAEKQ